MVFLKMSQKMRLVLLLLGCINVAPHAKATNGWEIKRDKSSPEARLSTTLQIFIPKNGSIWLHSGGQNTFCQNLSPRNLNLIYMSEFPKGTPESFTCNVFEDGKECERTVNEQLIKFNCKIWKSVDSAGGGLETNVHLKKPLETEN